jgi:hypothetical protein
MSPRRLVLLALALALAPIAARAAVPVAIYPFRVPGLTNAQRTELHGLLEAGIVSGARRGVLEPRGPMILPATCGDVPAAPCLATAAKGGLVLAGRGELRGGIVLLNAALYDRNGAKTREVRFVVDLVIQNLRPIGEALMDLEVEIEPDGTVAGSAKTPPPARDPRGPAPAVAAAPPPLPPRETPPPPPPPEVPAAPAGATRAPGPAKELAPETARELSAAAAAAVAVPVPAPAAPPPSLSAAPPAPDRAKTAKAAAPSKLDVSAPADRGAWKRQAGPLFTIVGGALLAGGAAVALVNKSLADDLEAKRASGSLTPADLASYDKVDRYNVLTTVLLAAGGVSAAAGGYLWITAPPKPGAPVMAVAGGRF